MQGFVEIDGGAGEGGGQILRTALSLSCVTGRPVRIANIRKGRTPPGLRPQHLAVVEALSRIAGATARGASPGSLELSFAPGGVRGGDFDFDIGTAGSTALLLQALIPPLIFQERTSRLRLSGGTHVPFSPPFEFLNEVFGPFLARLGIRVDFAIERYGFYPRGGGAIRAVLRPASGIGPIALEGRGPAVSVAGRSAVAGLPPAVAERQREAALRVLAAYSPVIETALVPAVGKGTFLFLRVDSDAGPAGFSALGAIGKRAEEVGREAAEAALAHIRSGSALDPRMADQAVLYLALSDRDSSFTTSRVTGHLATNLEVVRRFTGTGYEIRGPMGEPGLVVIRPAPRGGRPQAGG